MSSSSRTEVVVGPRKGGAQPAEKPLDEVSALNAHLGYWLRLVSNHVSHSFQSKVGTHGVTVAEWVVLRALFAHDEMRPSELSECLGLVRGTVSKLIDRLVKKDLVRCRLDLGDRRAQVVSLTPAGRRLVPKLAALADENDAQMFGPLGPEDQRVLLALLTRMVAVHGLKGTPVG